MRTLAATAIVSLAVHGAALGWVLHQRSSEKPEPAQPVVERAPQVPEDDLTVVTLLPDPVPTPAPVTVPTDRGEPAAGVVRRGTPAKPRESARIVSSATATPEPAGPEVKQPETTQPESKTKKPGVLAMRTGPQVKSTAEKLTDEAIAHPGVDRPLPDYPGNRDAVALDIARARGDIQGVVDAEDAIKNAELQPQKDGTFRSEKKTFVATVERDGTVHFKDKQNWHWQNPLNAEFDATDWAMRSHGIDPYAAEKLAYLDRTRDQRVEVAKVYRKEQLAHSSQLMLANLQRLWAMTQDVAARKRGVFELWEDCEETGEAEIVEGAEQARAQLARFVQVRLAGRDRYTDAELAQLNAHRRSKAMFDPYH